MIPFQFAVLGVESNAKYIWIAIAAVLVIVILALLAPTKKNKSEDASIKRDKNALSDIPDENGENK